MNHSVSTAQQTEGPWQLLAVGDNARLCPADAAGVSLLTIVGEGETDFAAVYNEADARLIAAAPELLGVLREVQQQCLSDDDHGVSVSEDVVIPSDLFDRICSAIAKAEGRTP